MEDYDVFAEMQNLDKKIFVAIIEDDENFIINNLMKIKNVELIPIRITYDLSTFSDEYREHTKSLFTYYFNGDNEMNNELLRLKKHFIHYRRVPNFIYIPNGEKYFKIRSLFLNIKIPVYSNLNDVVFKIKGVSINEWF